MAADDVGFIDLRPDNPGVDDPQARRLAVGRLQKLERMGLAAAVGPGQWMIGLKAEPVLHDLGMRGDTAQRWGQQLSVDNSQWHSPVGAAGLFHYRKCRKLCDGSEAL
jgi:type IV secretory pathway VirD2 relaxase